MTTGACNNEELMNYKHTFANHSFIGIFTTIIATLITLTQPALAEETPLAIELQADRAEIDATGRIGKYFGNVTLTRGDLTLKGDSMEIRSDTQRRISLITVTGKPAQVSGSVNTNTNDSFTATAQQVEYHIEPTEQLTLIGQATLAQDRNQFSGEKIEYFVATQRVIATGDTKNEQRVKITLYPDQLAPSSKDTHRATP